MEPPTRRRTTTLPADVVGLHVADDAVAVVRLTLAGPGRARWATTLRLPLPDGVVVAGLVRDRARFTEAVAPVRRFVGTAPVRVVVGSLDVTVVALPTSGHADPLAGVVARVAGLALPGDVVDADVVSVFGQPTGLAGALRSSLVRLTDALGAAGLVATSLDALPVALVATATALVPLPATTWTVRHDQGRLSWLATVGRAGRLEGAATWLAEPVASRTEVAAATSALPTVDVAAALAAVLTGPGRTDAAPFAPAFGAAIGAVSRVVLGPDLRVAAVHRALDGADDEALPCWAVEHVGPLAALDAACGRQPRWHRRGGPVR